MTTATDALVMAHEALVKQHPRRKPGNITVEPAAEAFEVVMVDLPSPGAPAVGAIRALVNRRSGGVTDVKELAVAKSPYSPGPVADATISGREAFDAALAAIKGYENYDKQGRITVALVEQVYQVTFPLLPAERTARGADYAFQVWIDSGTAKVVKVLVSS